MRERLLADWPLKALALALAFATWISITGQDRTLRDVVLPLEIDFGPERIAAVAPPTAVKVRLEGPRTTVRKLDPLRLAVRLDLRDAPLGQRDIPLTTSHLTGVPRGVDVSLFDPDRVRLDLVRRSQREFEVAPELVGEPPEGYVLYGMLVEPATVVVEGPQSAVDSMSTLRTEAIPLNDHTDAFLANVGLVPEDPLVRVLDTEDVEVQILVDVTPVERVFGTLQVSLPFTPEGPAKIKPTAVKVVLSGPPWLLERLEPTQISVVADVVQPGPRRPTRVPLLVQMRLPDERERLVTVESVRPTHVTLQIGG
jgi:YbbR domain-containing protein